MSSLPAHKINAMLHDIKQANCFAFVCVQYAQNLMFYLLLFNPNDIIFLPKNVIFPKKKN
jgi:hypothetical protein